MKTVRRDSGRRKIRDVGVTLIRRIVASTALFLALIFPLDVHSQFVTHHNPLPQQNDRKPPMGVWTIDQVFGTEIVRLTDARASGHPGIVPQYSKRQAWNANDSLLLLFNCAGTALLHNGRTYQFIRTIDGVFGEDVFWHPTKPNIIICSNERALLSYDVGLDRFDTVAHFPQYDWFNTRGEGNLSLDGRYYAFAGQTYDTATHIKDIVIYDLDRRTIAKSMPMPPALEDFDWVSISPLGNYVVIDYATTQTARYNGVEVYDRSMNFLWQKPLGAGHSDLAVDENDDEILVMDYYDDATNSGWIKKFRLADGKETKLLELNWSFDLHESCRNTARRGWCIVSTFDGEGRLTDDAASWLPFEDEVFMLKLDGSGTVQRLAHHHSRRFSPATPDRDNSNYYAEPHATVSRDGSRILFASNWREGIAIDSSVDTYLIDIRKKLSVDSKSDFIAANLSLSHFPNPFSHSTTITYHLPTRGHARLEVFDMLGRKVATLVDEEKEAGEHQIEFRIINEQSKMKAGMYFYRLTSGEQQETRKMIVLEK